MNLIAILLTISIVVNLIQLFRWNDKRGLRKHKVSIVRRDFIDDFKIRKLLMEDLRVTLIKEDLVKYDQGNKLKEQSFTFYTKES